MGMQAVIAEADPEADRQPMKDNGDGKIGPTEEEKCRDRQNMKDHHHHSGDPVQCRIGILRPNRYRLCAHADSSEAERTC
jgi:hypothetical protein